MIDNLLVLKNYPVPLAMGLLLLVGAVMSTYIVTWLIFKRRWNRIFRKRSHSVVMGLVNEQVAPMLEGFPGDITDCRFLGKPVDYLIFNGLSSGKVDEVIFVEVKSHSKIRLTPVEQSVREAIENRRVRWAQFSVSV